MNQYLMPLNDDMYKSIDDFIQEQCTYYGDENNCEFENYIGVAPKSNVVHRAVQHDTA